MPTTIGTYDHDDTDETIHLILREVISMKSELQSIHARLDEIKPVQGIRWKRQEMPEGWSDDAAQLRPDLDAIEEYAKFQDFWLENRTKKAIKVNWRTAWKNWIKGARAQEAVTATWRTNDHMATTKAKELRINDYGLTYEQLRRKIDEALRQ